MLIVKTQEKLTKKEAWDTVGKECVHFTKKIVLSPLFVLAHSAVLWGKEDTSLFRALRGSVFYTYEEIWRDTLGNGMQQLKRAYSRKQNA